MFFVCSEYIVKAMESVDSGGYQGLVHQANIGNKEDVSGLSDGNETQLVYMMQTILLGIKGDLKDIFMQFQSKMHDMVNTGQTSRSTKKSQAQARMPIVSLLMEITLY